MKKSASAAGTSSWRAAVPGSASVAYEPPCPGPKQNIASVATSTDDARPAASRRRRRPPPRRRRTRAARAATARAGRRAGIDAGDPRDEREEAVPQRERVAGVQPAVLELVDGAQVQVAELDELPHARLVEEAVAGDGALDVPEQPAEHDAPREPDEPRAAGPRRRSPVARTRARRRSAATKTTQRARRPRGGSSGAPRTRPPTRRRRAASRPREHRGGAALPERARDGPARARARTAVPKASRR